MALFKYYELFELDIVSWEVYNARTDASCKLVEGAETLLKFLENTIFVSTEMDQEVEFYQELAELVNLAKSVWIKLSSTTSINCQKAPKI